MRRTENYNLPQFEQTDPYKLEDYNEAYRVIDEKLKEANDKGTELTNEITEAQTTIDTWTDFKDNGGRIAEFVHIDSEYQEHKLKSYEKTLMDKIDYTKGAHRGYYDKYGNLLGEININNDKDIELNAGTVALNSPMYVRDSVSGAQKNPSEYSRICRSSYDADKGQMKIQLGNTGKGGFEIVNSEWNKCLFGVGEEYGAKFTSADGATGLKIDGRLIESVNDALALKAPKTEPIYYIRDKNNNVDVLLPGGVADIGAPTQTFNNIYVGNFVRNANGYSVLPNGLIMQWGNFTLKMGYGDSISTTVTLPISYTNGIFTQGAICSYNTSAQGIDWTSAVNTSVMASGRGQLIIESRGMQNGMAYQTYEIRWWTLGQ